MMPNSFILFYSLATVVLVPVKADSMLDWIWGGKKESPKVVVADGVPLIDIPYELLTEDEKFLKEAAKLTQDIQVSSPLEICQHKVVMKIRTSCSSMTEEELAKLSVNLLNCQSMTEGRKVFPCSEEMSLKQCTTNMDADTWNAYHLMSNRARAVCYAARSNQFRALTELTVNKLMQSAHSQIQTLAVMKESQDRLEEQSVTAHKIIESNIQDLTDEKALIRTGHIQLATMVEDIKKKLENASRELLDQSEERGRNHQDILEDLENIKIQSELLWDKIESSTNRIIEQNYETALQYEETLKKLEKINETIVFVWDLTNNMRAEMDKKLGWILDYIGTTGENLEKVYRIVLHVVYLLAAMVVAAFLQAPFLTRSAILGVVPLNLASYLKHGLTASLDFISLSMLIALITAMHYIMNGIQYLVRSRIDNDKMEEKPTKTCYLNGQTKLYGSANNFNHVENHFQSLSLMRKIVNHASNFLNFINDEIHLSLEHLKNMILSTKSWFWQKLGPTEELSCSYLPSRKINENIISRGHASISDDSSEMSDSRDSGKFFTINSHTPTGAVLRKNVVERIISPPTSVYRGHMETIVSRPKGVPSRSVTPVSRNSCGAKTRSGNPCRLVAMKGKNYCHIHESGSSEMGD